jgi:hypothetical protein
MMPMQFENIFMAYVKYLFISEFRLEGPRKATKITNKEADI